MTERHPKKYRAIFLTIGLASLLTLMSGCVSQEQVKANHAVEDYFVGDFQHSESQLRPLAQKPDENYVLNNERLGSAALANYDLDAAESAFLRAYEVINSTGVNDPARAAATVLFSENVKVWKGEPFERAMLNFYLGLTYYMHHEYDNARAAFENALFKLRDYGKDGDASDQYRQVESNFVLAYLMLGRCDQRLGKPDDARKAFDRVVDLRPDLRTLADYHRNEQSNMLLVVDYGFGPEKMASRDGTIAGFRPTPRQEGPIPLPVLTVDDRPVNVSDAALPPIDLLALAQDRQWQTIDTIRAVKSVLGTGLIAGGAAYAGTDRRANPYVALSLIASGVALKASSQADLRRWEFLPRTVFIIPLSAPAGKHNVRIEFPGMAGMRQTWNDLIVPPTGEVTYYFRMERGNVGPYSWPPPAMVKDESANPTAPVTPANGL